MENKRPLILTDADNTLWDTDAVYVDAQFGILECVERTVGVTCTANDRLAYVRAVDQELARIHHMHLRYPPKLLSTALALTLSGTKVKEAARLANSSTVSLPYKAELDAHADWFSNQIKNGIPHLRPGVFDGMAKIHDAGMLLIVATETDSVRCERLLKHHKLFPLINRIIAGLKRVEFYTRIAKKFAVPPELCFIVGDQLDRDIAPAKSANYRTIYFPGNFQPSWAPEEHVVSPDFKISSFLDVYTIVDGAIKKHKQGKQSATEKLKVPQ